MMNLYLVQHGKAASDEDDPKRPLSDIGRNELLRVMTFLDSHPEIKVDTIFHSGKLRAEQTATLLAASIKPAGGMNKIDGLAPMDDPALWANKLGDMNQNVMLVGHLPHLARLASLLLTGDPSRELIHFRNAGIVCLNRRPDAQWVVSWVIVPDLLP